MVKHGLAAAAVVMGLSSSLAWAEDAPLPGLDGTPAAATAPAPADAATAPVDTIPVESAPAEEAPAMKQESRGIYAEVYFVPATEFSQGGSSVDGDGLGVRGMLPFGPGARALFLKGEYSRTELSDVDQTVQNLRFGMGYQLTPVFSAYGEYASIKFNNTLDGLGLHGRASVPYKDKLGFHGEIGYLMLTNSNGPDVDGIEYSLGATYKLNDQYSALLDYRSVKLSADSAGPDADLSDLKLGVRIAIK